ncbi:sensor histidine kinase [Streptomyces sp. NPDC088725]|uniref:sensor histidine kinase n=1 Tax=Streptomyces sp. NPDC088725 TaxID=3365873 RepID=UPI00380542A8
MSVPVTPSPHRIRKTRSLSLFLPLALLVMAGGVASAVAAAAPEPARAWVTSTVTTAWVCLALTVVTAALLLNRARRGALAADGEIRTIQARLARTGADASQLVNVTLPAVVKRLRDGVDAEEALEDTRRPTDPQLRRVLQVFAVEVAASERRAATADAECGTAVRRLSQSADELDRLTTKTLPAAIGGLRQGGSADTVLGSLDPPADPRLRVLMDALVREFAISERRSAAAQGAGTKALSRVQAKAVSMLADLREMQDRYGEEIFGDLLQLDHNTSQLGMLADRLSILMGGRGSRSWNRPIVMESILRGAVGRIAAYRRVRLHCSSNAAIAGFAAEGVMHLLAELMDNAANFSPPIDEVHVYVEERAAGIVVTIEDSGLKMADAAMRRAEESVSGRSNDLATLQGTRLGLAVVGRLAAKYRMSVNFRPSSRGGTGVVVLFPPQLLAQQRDVDWEQTVRRPVLDPPPARAFVPAPASPPPTTLPPAELPRAELPPAGADVSSLWGQGPRVATPGGLPVRPPGRTMAAADRDRPYPDVEPGPGPETGEVRPGRDAGSQFRAFHRSRHSSGGPDSTPAE